MIFATEKSLRAVVRAVVALLGVGFTGACVHASTPEANPSPCMADQNYRRLDFWLGDWEALDGHGAVVGSVAVRRILKGCAVQYAWKDPDGSETLELFYFVPARKEWRQVLISDGARTQERAMPDSVAGADAVQFTGTALRANGGNYFNRSTATRLNNNEIHQVIDRSLDGQKWEVTFDVRYRRRKTP